MCSVSVDRLELGNVELNQVGSAIRALDHVGEVFVALREQP